MAESDDLNALLDSALDDFRNVESLHRNQSHSESCSQPPVEVLDATSLQSEMPTLGQGLGIGLPTLETKSKKSVSFKGKSGITPSSSRKEVATGHLSDTLEELAQQTRKTLEELETPADEEVMADKLVESIVKQFEELGTNQDMQSIMDTMMRQLLSKDVLHEPMKEIGEKYPEWLETNKASIDANDYDRYSRQYQLIKDLCNLYETTPDDFQKIVDIMQQMQACGQPPTELVQELAPGVGVGEDGLPVLSELLQDSNGQQNCSIM